MEITYVLLDLNFLAVTGIVTRSLSPSGPGLFRKVVRETSYNGYRIPAGESIQWNTSIGCRAKSLYPEPEK